MNKIFGWFWLGDSRREFLLQKYISQCAEWNHNNNFWFLLIPIQLIYNSFFSSFLSIFNCSRYSLPTKYLTLKGFPIDSSSLFYFYVFHLCFWIINDFFFFYLLCCKTISEKNRLRSVVYCIVDYWIHLLTMFLMALQKDFFLFLLL